MAITLRVRDVEKRLSDEGWYVDRHDRSSHKKWKHPNYPDRLVVTAGKPSEDIATGTLRRIFRDAGWPWPPR